MVIELLGTRVIAPFYGTSLYVWSSLISVTMIALATGYFVGGWWADRAQRIGLSVIVSLAGLATLCIPWLNRPVLLATDPLGLRGGAFVSALVLFGPSLTLLGMVGPFSIKLGTSRLEGVGSSAGTIYAISTLGSVIGALLLGFLLFPLVGSGEILVGLSGVLLVLGIAVTLVERSRLGRTAIAWPSAILAIAGLALLPQVLDAKQAHTGGRKFQIRSEEESVYGRVRVIDQPERDLRLSTSDASVIGAASISKGESLLVYQEIVNLLPAVEPSIRRALLIGQGAGHMATGLRDRHAIVTDTIEVDPAVAEAAAGYFGFVPTGKLRVGDGRREVRELQGPYDLIIHDCFTGGSEPAHLLTAEALQQLRGLLAANGILSLNFVAFGEGGKNSALASVARTIRQVFPHQTVFVSEPGEDFNDYIFLASGLPISLEAPSLTADQARWLKARLFPVDETAGVVLTDDFNPLEYLQLGKAERYRHVLVEWFGPEWLLR